MSDMTQIWAHRGASAHAPANTMEAFSLAIEHGAEGIELDVHLTRDRQLVVHHDDTVEHPAAGMVSFADLTLDELAEVDLGDGHGRPARIPRLAEVYELLTPTSLRLNVEIKGSVLRYPGIDEALLAVHESSGLPERLIYSCFDHHTLVALRELAPQVQIAPLYAGGLVDPWVYLRHLGVSAAHPHYLSLFTPGILEGLASAGIAVRAWTVNDPAHLRWLLAAGIDAVMTDDPGAAVALRTSLTG